MATKYDNHLGDGLTTYRKRNSCETALIGLVEDWKLARDNHLLVGILSTDMSKAFDCLNPPLMLCKLKALPFPGQSTRFATQLPMQSLRESAHRVGNQLMEKCGT